MQQAAASLLRDPSEPARRKQTTVAVRRRNRAAFLAALKGFKSSAQGQSIFGGGDSSTAATTSATTTAGLRVCVRKRPLFEHETSAGDWDAWTRGGNIRGAAAQSSVWAHKGGVRLDMKHMFIEHHGYCFDSVFDEKDDSRQVYESAVAPLVAGTLAAGGQHNAVLMFGQTGSGKTFTMTALAELVAENLFPASSQSESESVVVSITCLEIAGGHCTDLVTGEECALRDDGTGQLVIAGAQRNVCADAAALVAVLGAAYARRATSATGVHDASSRSHAVYRVSIEHRAKAGGPAPDATTTSTLTLADLAGSEWAKDQASHSKDRIEETKQISASLLALKQCIRARVARDRRQAAAAAGAPAVAAAGTALPVMPVRDSKLTRVLQSCFTDPAASTLVIATVSPSTADLEHSMDTLGHTSLLVQGGGDVAASPSGDDAHGSNAAAEVITQNVPGEAVMEMMPGQVDSAYEEEGKGRTAAEAGQLATTSTATTAGAAAGSTPADPRKWTDGDVCFWWVDAASAALSEVRADMAAATGASYGASPVEPPARFEVLFAPKNLVLEKVVSAELDQRRGPAGRIGVAFLPATPAAPTDGGDDDGSGSSSRSTSTSTSTSNSAADVPPTVKSIGAMGIASMLKEPRLRPGCQLVAVDRRSGLASAAAAQAEETKSSGPAASEDSSSSTSTSTSTLATAAAAGAAATTTPTPTTTTTTTTTSTPKAESPEAKSSSSGSSSSATDDAPLRTRLLTELKRTTKALYKSVDAWAAWKLAYDDAVRPRCFQMDGDAAALRAYVTGQTAEEVQEEMRRKQEEFEANPPVPPPPPDADEHDFVLGLTFTEAPPQPPRMPQVPRVFTGESRIGIFKGDTLCRTYGCADFADSQFRAACGGDDRVAKYMWLQLRGLMAADTDEGRPVVLPAEDTKRGEE
eukprot:g4275.t1